MKKGFTLVEIIAVITIIGTLVVIIAPSVIEVMDNAEKDTFSEFAKGVVRTVTNDIDNKNYKSEKYFIKNGQIFDSKNIKLKTIGGSNENGIANVNNSGKVEIIVHSDKWCATKDYNSTKVIVEKYNGNNCKIINK